MNDDLLHQEVAPVVRENLEDLLHVHEQEVSMICSRTLQNPVEEDLEDLHVLRNAAHRRPLGNDWRILLSHRTRYVHLAVASAQVGVRGGVGQLNP